MNFTKKNIRNHLHVLLIAKQYLEPMDLNLAVEVASKFNNPKLICTLFNEYNNLLNMNHINKLNAAMMVLKMQGFSFIEESPNLWYTKGAI